MWKKTRKTIDLIENLNDKEIFERSVEQLSNSPFHVHEVKERRPERSQSFENPESLLPPFSQFSGSIDETSADRSSFLLRKTNLSNANWNFIHPGNDISRTDPTPRQKWHTPPIQLEYIPIESKQLFLLPFFSFIFYLPRANTRQRERMDGDSLRSLEE